MPHPDDQKHWSRVEYLPTKFEALKPFLCSSDLDALIAASTDYDQGQAKA